MLPIPVAPNRPFALYILSHGCPGGTQMSSGTDTEGGERWWGPDALARKLIERGLPQNRPGRIRLCLCHSAHRYEGRVFAQLVAQALCMRQPTANCFSQIAVGGFNSSVHWEADKRQNTDDLNELVKRDYFECNSAGTPVENKYAQLQYSKVIAQDDKWAYFPFKYLELPPA